ncbi:hexosaminidase D-like [Pieris rapae]|uniref:hexosaminidase D-like n=1 Tax=Pieris rapae TaxID=64459 RepID=UPI001E27BF2C|nr:hexosaminidase D-like [Pieris rapae]
MNNLKNQNDKYLKIKMRPILARTFKHKIVILTTFSLIYFIIILILINTWFLKSMEMKSQLSLENVIVHFDFKGSPPKMSYLTTLLPKFKYLGVTGLLMEYEDMFPYEDKLVNLSARNCYEKSELFEFVSLATQSGLEIIPLIQTFGHMEHALKLKQFQHLREEPLYPDSICPSRVESQDLIKNMIEQVATFHNDIAPLKRIHLGCDEVYHINKCHLCRRRDLKDIEIFVKHVKIVTDIVKKISPNTTVLVWDDGLRDVPIYKWDNYIKNLSVEPVYWDYRPSLSVSHVSLMKYYYSFQNIWIASAYKGADGRVATFPDIKKRLLNNFSWLSIISNYKFGGMTDLYSFKGIILTGWSRYSHMDPPCELFHNAIPTLFVNLLLVKHFKENGYSDADDELNLSDYFDKYLKNKFNSVLECKKVTINYIDPSQCKFDGKEIYQLHLHLKRLFSDVTFNMNDEVRGLSAVDYYSKTHNTNVNNVNKDLEWTNTTIKELLQIEHRLRQTLLQYYDVPFVNEYLNYKLYNCKKTIFSLSKHLKDMLKTRSWDRGPNN